jgi:hypothetical protein
MRNRNFTVTSANIESGNVQLIDNIPIGETITPVNNNDNNPIYYYYPKQLLIKNVTGAEIGFNVFESTAEYNDYLTSNTNYQLIRIANNTTYEFKSLPKTEKIVIQKISGTASSNLIVQCINYKHL